jgi:hypothetical protein
MTTVITVMIIMAAMTIITMIHGEIISLGVTVAATGS